LISLGLGGLITASIQFAFEHTIPDWRRRKAAKSTFHRYAYPLILSAFLLFREIHKIEHHAKEFEEFKKKYDPNIKEDYYCFSKLYTFGRFFG
jgi:hypothetical protein